MLSDDRSGRPACLHFLRRFRHVKQPCLVRCRVISTGFAIGVDMSVITQIFEMYSNYIHFSWWVPNLVLTLFQMTCSWQ